MSAINEMAFSDEGIDAMLLALDLALNSNIPLPEEATEKMEELREGFQGMKNAIQEDYKKWKEIRKAGEHERSG